MDLAIQGGLSPPRLPVSPPGRVRKHAQTTSLTIRTSVSHRVRILPSMPGRLTRGAWFACGWVAVGIGTIGIVVPGLPTTVFFIVAAACFSRSSPRFEQWVLDRPGIGPMVRDYRSGLGMPRSAKTAAISSIAIVCSLERVRHHERLGAALDHPRRRCGRHRLDPVARADPPRRQLEPSAVRARPDGSASPRSPRPSPGSACSSAWRSSTSAADRRSACRSSDRSTGSSCSPTSRSRCTPPASCGGAAGPWCWPCSPPCRPGAP